MFGLSLFRPSRQSNISTSGEERFKYPLPWENRISQMPYPRANKDNQIPKLDCLTWISHRNTSFPAWTIFVSRDWTFFRLVTQRFCTLQTDILWKTQAFNIVLHLYNTSKKTLLSTHACYMSTWCENNPRELCSHIFYGNNDISIPRVEVYPGDRFCLTIYSMRTMFPLFVGRRSKEKGNVNLSPSWAITFLTKLS